MIYSDCCGASGSFNRLHYKIKTKETVVHENIELIRIYSPASHQEKSFASTLEGGVWTNAAFRSKNTLSLELNSTLTQLKAGRTTLELKEIKKGNYDMANWTKLYDFNKNEEVKLEKFKEYASPSYEYQLIHEDF